MRQSLSIVLLVAVILSALYFHASRFVPCQVPITYSLGVVDERFNLSNDAVLSVLREAEAVWEMGSEELFTYDAESSFKVNFVFDERQEQAEAEFGFQEKLNQAESVNEALQEKYQSLTAEYDDLKGAYEARSAEYEAELTKYNNLVASYNNDGGAPPEVYEDLERMRTKLDREQRELGSTARELNQLVDNINQVGKEANVLVETYNRGVGEYNETFGRSREFTQGDYRGNEINVYTFTNEAELVLVLAHELGHALGIDHVEGRQSIMYYLIGEQPADLKLSEYDMSALTTVCTEKSVWDTLTRSLRDLLG